MTPLAFFLLGVVLIASPVTAFVVVLLLAQKRLNPPRTNHRT